MTGIRSAVAVMALAAAALAGCADEPPPATPPAPPAAPPTADPLAQFAPGERAFIQAYTRGGYSNSGGNAAIARMGQLICAEIRQGVPPADTQAALAGAGGLAQTDAAVVYELAHRNMCVDAPLQYSTATSTAPPPPAGPLMSFGDGLWEVGVDVEAGKYKTSGSDSCYYAILASTDSSDILDNNAGAGPRTVTIRDGQYFESQRCGTWTRQ
jgi:hypothetical protein